jgi:hypothetical protein
MFLRQGINTSHNRKLIGPKQANDRFSQPYIVKAITLQVCCSTSASTDRDRKPRYYDTADAYIPTFRRIS